MDETVEKPSLGKAWALDRNNLSIKQSTVSVANVVSRLCHARLRYDLPPRAQASAETVDFHMKTVIASCLWSRDTKKYRGETKPNKRRGLWEISTLDFQVRVLPAKVGREGKAFAIFEFCTVLTT